MKILFVILLLVSSPWALAELCSVEDFLAKVCLADEPQKLVSSEVASLNCRKIESSPRIEAQVREAFALAPSWLQGRLCRLKGFGIYPTEEGRTILSWAYPDENFIGVSKQFIEQEEGFDRIKLAARKHALAKKSLSSEYPEGFGFSSRSSHSRQALGLLYTMAHEIGHIIYNGPAEERGPWNFGRRCFDFESSRICPRFVDHHWGYFSWLDPAGPDNSISYGSPRPEFAKLVSFVQPSRTETVSVAELDAFFQDFFASPFPTVFGLYSPEEDFCETLAVQVLAPLLESWEFRFSDGRVYDFRQRSLNPVHPVMQKKMDFCAAVLD